MNCCSSDQESEGDKLEQQPHDVIYYPQYFRQKHFKNTETLLHVAPFKN